MQELYGKKNSETVKALSGGSKIGWKIPLHDYGFPFDVEPYFYLGLKFLCNSEDSVFLESTFYLGTQLDIY